MGRPGLDVLDRHHHDLHLAAHDGDAGLVRTQLLQEALRVRLALHPQPAWVETNAGLKDHPQFVNEDPYGKGWIVKMEMENKEEIKGLLSVKSYQGTLPEEG